MANPPGNKTLLPQCLGAVGFLLSTGVMAQGAAPVALERQTDDAFKQVLQQPQELSGWAKYAQLQIEAGNYEGGIAALERLLLDPNASPDLRVDVAALYFRLGSYATAEAMLDTALADRRLQGDKRIFAEQLKADVAKRNQRSQLRGAVTFGLRHQTNPTYRTDTSQILSSGGLYPVPADQRPDDDTDVNLGLRLNHLYDLDRQNSAAIVSNLGAYLVNYRSSSGSQLVANQTKPYDLQVLDLNTGLQFKPAPELANGLTLRPHVLLANVSAQSHQYVRSHGLGLDLNWQANERTLYELTVDGQNRNFADRIDVSNASLLDGNLYSLRGRVVRELAPGQVLVGDVALRRSRSERDFYDFDSEEARVTYSISYASPISKGNYWTTALWLGVLHRGYKAPDAAVSAIETRSDREWRVGVNQVLQLAPAWSLILSVEHSRNDANMPNYRYKNTSLSGTVVRSF